MLGMISRQRHHQHTTNNQGAPSGTAQTYTGQPESDQGGTTASEVKPTAVETTEEESSTAAGEPGIDTAESKVPQQQQTETSNSADDTNSSTPPGAAPSDFPSNKVSAEGLAAHEAASDPGTAEYDDVAAGHDPSAAQSPAEQSTDVEQPSATVPAAGVESDEPGQAFCNGKTGSDTGKPDDGQTRTTDGIGTASCQSDSSGKKPEQAERGSGTADMDGKAPQTPTKKAPKKGGLVNVQRPAVKGYSIHRSASCPCRACTPLALMHCSPPHNTQFPVYHACLLQDA